MSAEPLKPIVEQATSLLELVFDEAMRRANQRYSISDSQDHQNIPLWIEGAEAVNIMGAGYTLPRLKQLGHEGQLIMDRKDPDKPNSPYIFLRSSLLEFSAKRVFDLENK